MKKVLFFVIHDLEPMAKPVPEQAMFEIQTQLGGRGVRWYAAGLAALSLIALTVTTWILIYVQREQDIVARIIQHLPASDLAAARELSGDLRLQYSLSILLVINLIATAIAFTLFLRGYLSSERSLRDVKVVATDILASMDAGVITTDQYGAVTSINPSGRTLIGLPDTGIGRLLAEIDPRHALLDSICREVGTRHQPIRDRDYVVNRGGRTQTLRAGCSLLRNRGGDEIGAVIHVRDVTERSLIEQRLRRMERYSGLGSLAAGLQHEIKNPLSALSLHIQLLSERLADQPADSDVHEMLDVLDTEVKRINAVLDGFRNYASITELGRTRVDVSTLIGKLVRLLRPQAQQQNVVVQWQLPKQPVGTVEADSGRIEQVLLNLALNGLAAMPDGGTLSFRISRNDDTLRIDVEDTGCGIPPEVQSKIFDPYFTTRNDGTGMGLALCDKIVRQHDGSIDVRTSPAGTEFAVSLPIGSRE